MAEEEEEAEAEAEKEEVNQKVRRVEIVLKK